MLIQLASAFPALPANIMRPILEGGSPQCKVWDSKDIYNVRTKIRGLKLKLTDSQTRNFEAFAATFKNEGFSKLFLDQHNHFADKTPFKRRTPLEENDSDKDDRKLGAAGTLSVCGRQIDAVKLHGYPFLTTKSL